VFALLKPEEVVSLARRACEDDAVAAWLSRCTSTEYAFAQRFRAAALPVRGACVAWHKV
jgi:hypothetical protein